MGAWKCKLGGALYSQLKFQQVRLSSGESNFSRASPLRMRRPEVDFVTDHQELQENIRIKPDGYEEEREVEKGDQADVWKTPGESFGLAGE